VVFVPKTTPVYVDFWNKNHTFCFKNKNTNIKNNFQKRNKKQKQNSCIRGKQKKIRFH
jgi:hypothetical protein